MKKDWEQAAGVLRKDGIVVLSTDTLYGIIGSALSKKAVERVYHIKGRDKGKPCIVLVSSFADLELFGVHIDSLDGGRWEPFLHTFWPDKISIVLPCSSQKWRYLHRGSGGIAFRMVGPKHKNLYQLLQAVGPLVAPSANPQGEAPARTITEAKNYFTNTVDMYINSGTLASLSSTLVSLLGSYPKVLRHGAVDIHKEGR
jgi:L-threonylcarbamoyladenylate synthase